METNYGERRIDSSQQRTFIRFILDGKEISVVPFNGKPVGKDWYFSIETRDFSEEQLERMRGRIYPVQLIKEKGRSICGLAKLSGYNWLLSTEKFWISFKGEGEATFD